jgi:hypothetical protein
VVAPLALKAVKQIGARSIACVPTNALPFAAPASRRRLAIE